MNEDGRPAVAIIGLGKMGLSHLAIANASNRIRVAAICDTSSLLGQIVHKYTGLQYVGSYEETLSDPNLQGVVIATPTKFHETMIRDAFAHQLHVFCEKPLTLSGSISAELAEEGRRLGLVCQVGYHNRFVGTFSEVKRLIAAGAIGRVRHIHGEAYGPVVLRPTAKTWRSQAELGGGCLYDYAAHPVNLMNWYAGPATDCGGADLTNQYSVGVEDAVYANLRFKDGISGQVSVNWSDETARKMTTKVTVWGDGGRISADRQEIQVFIGATGKPPEGYRRGWTVRYITELAENVDFYLRGEEYSAQIDAFGRAISESRIECVNDFTSAAETDLTLEMIRDESRRVRTGQELTAARPLQRRQSLLSRMFGR